MAERMKRKTKNCEYCGDEFEWRPHTGKRFCNELCRQRAYDGTPLIPNQEKCEACNAPLLHPVGINSIKRFCDRACKQYAYRQRKKK